MELEEDKRVLNEEFGMILEKGNKEKICLYVITRYVMYANVFIYLHTI